MLPYGLNVYWAKYGNPDGNVARINTGTVYTVRKTAQPLPLLYSLSWFFPVNTVYGWVTRDTVSPVFIPTLGWLDSHGRFWISAMFQGPTSTKINDQLQRPLVGLIFVGSRTDDGLDLFLLPFCSKKKKMRWAISLPSLWAVSETFFLPRISDCCLGCGVC